MNKKALGILGALVVVGGGAWFMFRGTQGGSEIEYRYAPVEQRDLLLSTSSTGRLVPLTQVDVKSKAGGKVVKLLVNEGSVVSAGQLVAEIDPRDVQANFEQAEADVSQAQSRVDQAKNNARLAELNASNNVREAEVALNLARIRLTKAQDDAKTQPQLTTSAIRNAEASLATQRQALVQLKNVTVPTRRRQAETGLNKARVDMQTAQTNLNRQKELFELGYVAKTAVEQAQTSFEAAKAAYEVAQVTKDTLDDDLDAEIKSAEYRVQQAEATLNQAKANSVQDVQSKRTVDEARRAVEQAEIALKQAKDNQLQVRSSKIDILSADAQAVRSRVAMGNAQTQLVETKVLAPRAGVVTTKYLEEGTIIPPGTSTFSEGTSIVQISDISTMFVECSVDEADISQLKVKQRVLIIVEAYPGEQFTGEVERIFPAADSEGAVTSIKVRVKIDPVAAAKLKQKPLRPGMNATCEFLQFEKKDIIVIPSQAVKNEGESDYVLVKGADEKNPIKRTITLGESGNDGVEVLEGLKAGEEIVVAEIDLAAMRDRQNRMIQAEQGGGLGAQRSGGPSRSRAGN